MVIYLIKCCLLAHLCATAIRSTVSYRLYPYYPLPRWTCWCLFVLHASSQKKMQKAYVRKKTVLPVIELLYMFSTGDSIFHNILFASFVFTEERYVFLSMNKVSLICAKWQEVKCKVHFSCTASHTGTVVARTTTEVNGKVRNLAYMISVLIKHWPLYKGSGDSQNILDKLTNNSRWIFCRKLLYILFWEIAVILGVVLGRACAYRISAGVTMDCCK